MEERSILEVETPVLNRAGNTDPNILSLETQVSSPGHLQVNKRYLHTSPEFAMKRLLASGSGSIYQITKVFRDNELGRLHQHEFTMLEWYREGFDHHDLMDEIDNLLYEVGLEAAGRKTYAELFEEFVGLNPHTSALEELRQTARDAGLKSEFAEASEYLEFIYSHQVAPNLGYERPVFVYDYPACQAALAKVSQGPGAPAERFELFIKGIEIANGYNELKDYIEVNNRFRQENKIRMARGLPEVYVDNRLLLAQQYGLPDCAGVALGFDRLVMAISGSKELVDVIAFPDTGMSE